MLVLVKQLSQEEQHVVRQFLKGLEGGAKVITKNETWEDSVQESMFA